MDKFRQLWRDYVWPLALSVLLSAVGLVSYADVAVGSEKAVPAQGWLVYFQMALDPHYSAPNPFGLRRMSPWLVRQITSLGIDSHYAWALLTGVALAASFFMIYVLVWKVGKTSRLLATILTIVAGTNYWFALFNFRYYWLVDPLNTFFWVLAIYSVLQRRLLTFFFALAVGMMNKEVVLLLLPLPYLLYLTQWRTQLERRVWRDMLIKLVIGTVALVALYLAYRAWWIAQFDATDYTWLGVGVLRPGQAVLENFQQLKDFHWIWSNFDFLWVLAPYGAYLIWQRQAWRSTILVTAAYLFVVTTAARLFTDPPRAYALLVPAVLLLLIPVFGRRQSKVQVRVLLVLLAAYVFRMYGPATYAFQPGMVSAEIGAALSLAALAMYALAYPEPEQEDYA